MAPAVIAEPAAVGPHVARRGRAAQSRWWATAAVASPGERRQLTLEPGSTEAGGFTVVLDDRFTTSVVYRQGRTECTMEPAAMTDE